MELIQPFINAADAVLGETLNCATSVGEVSMGEEVYRRKGVAALVAVHGDIEGRVIFDLEPAAAAAVTSRLAGSPGTGLEPLMVEEAICELANQVIGNAVTVLNDQGFRFRVQPPIPHTAEAGNTNTHDTEAMVMSFTTDSGTIFMNVSMRYSHREDDSQ